MKHKIFIIYIIRQAYFNICTAIDFSMHEYKKSPIPFYYQSKAREWNLKRPNISVALHANSPSLLHLRERKFRARRILFSALSKSRTFSSLHKRSDIAAKGTHTYLSNVLSDFMHLPQQLASPPYTLSRSPEPSLYASLPTGLTVNGSYKYRLYQLCQN